MQIDANRLIEALKTQRTNALDALAVAEAMTNHLATELEETKAKLEAFLKKEVSEVEGNTAAVQVSATAADPTA